MRKLRLAVAGVVFVVSVGCAGEAAERESEAAEQRVAATQPQALLSQAGGSVLRCGPSTIVRRDSAVARPTGVTTLQIPVQGGPPYRLRIPSGAISESSRRFFLEVTASDTVKVRVWAEGFENSRYGFVPGTRAQLWISGNRCSDAAVDTLQVPRILLIRPNGSITDVGGQPDGSGGGNPRKWMRAELDSLSVYAIGTI